MQLTAFFCSAKISQNMTSTHLATWTYKASDEIANVWSTTTEFHSHYKPCCQSGTFAANLQQICILPVRIFSMQILSATWKRLALEALLLDCLVGSWPGKSHISPGLSFLFNQHQWKWHLISNWNTLSKLCKVHWSLVTSAEVVHPARKKLRVKLICSIGSPFSAYLQFFCPAILAPIFSLFAVFVLQFCPLSKLFAYSALVP